MGWVWRDDEDDQFHTSSRDNSEIGSSDAPSGERCSTRKLVKSQCITQEVEPGKFVRKCHETHEILKECIGKPVEVVQSNEEYKEDDVTEEVLRGRGGSSRFASSSSSHGNGVFDFPGLRSDLEAMEHNLTSGLTRFLEAAEEMKNGFFDVLSKAPHITDGKASSSSSSPSPRKSEHEATDVDLSAQAKDV